MLIGLPMGPGSWQMEVKGGTTPRSNGISAIYPEANDLIGETLSPHGKGRAAVTQFYYRLSNDYGTFSSGLLFSPSYLDTNPIADDEYREFLGTTFVNDPTIALPNYVLGGAAKGPIDHALAFSYTLFVSSTADLYQHSYTNLSDFSGNGHGAFTAIELDWKYKGLSGNVGLWRNGDDRFRQFSSGAIQADYGAYTNVNGIFSSVALQWNVRLGWANPHVSEANKFIAGELAYTRQLPFPRFNHSVTYGVGLPNTWASPDMSGPKASRQQAEVYTKVLLVDTLSTTLDLQYIRHSQFNPDDGSTLVEGIRIADEF